MSAEWAVIAEGCSKRLVADFDVGRRVAFARLFRRGRALSPAHDALAVYPFRDIDLRIRAGEKLNIAGPPMAGKTMLGYLLAGLVTPTEGTVRRSHRVGYFTGLPGFVPRLMKPPEYVGFSIHVGGHGGAIAPSSTDELLEVTGLDAYRARYLRDIPVERLEALQLELFRRSRSRILVLDEPASEIWEALRTRPDFAETTVIVLSRRAMFDFSLERLAVLSGGRMIYDGAWDAGVPVLAQAVSEAPGPRRARRPAVDDDLDDPESEV